MYARGVDREVEWPGCTISVVGQQKRIVSAIIEMTMQVEWPGLHHLFSRKTETYRQCNQRDDNAGGADKVAPSL